MSFGDLKSRDDSGSEGTLGHLKQTMARHREEHRGTGEVIANGERAKGPTDFDLLLERTRELRAASTEFIAEERLVANREALFETALTEVDEERRLAQLLDQDPVEETAIDLQFEEIHLNDPIERRARLEAAREVVRLLAGEGVSSRLETEPSEYSDEAAVTSARLAISVPAL